MRQRVPRWSRPYRSEVGPNMQIWTSAMSPYAALRTLWIRFSAASLDGRSLDRWLPTRTIGDVPLAIVSRDSFTHLTRDYLPRDRARQVRIDPVYNDRVTILYYYPGMNPDLVDALVEKGYRGIVIAGTGLGHVNKPLYPALSRAIRAGVHVVMTVQTLWGYVQMYVYDTGRDLMDLGIVPLENMLPETSLMKLCWVLGHTDDHDEVMRMMRQPVNYEITAREPHNGYLIMQGGLPEIEEYIATHWK